MGQSAVANAKMGELAKTQNSPESTHAGVEFPPYFTARLEPGKTPYDDVQWETRTATIGNDKGSVIFEQRDIEVPTDWSQTATNIVASKYFHGKLGSPERERSVGELVHRVVDTIADWGIKDGYFATAEDGENFRNELAHLMLHQKAAFNSPVWFNVGVKESRGYGWFYEAAEQRIRKLTSEAKPQCRLRIPSNPFSISPRPKACSSSGVPARVRTSPPCARKTPFSPAVDGPAALCLS